MAFFLALLFFAHAGAPNAPLRISGPRAAPRQGSVCYHIGQMALGPGGMYICMEQPKRRNVTRAVAPEDRARIARIARAISRQEGWNKDGTLVRRLNNPGALKYVGQKNAVRGKNGYASFETPEDGWSALQRDLEKKFGRGMSLQQVMKAWTVGAGYLPVIETATGLPGSYRITPTSELALVPSA